jgi:hypothetical protein
MYLITIKPAIIKECTGNIHDVYPLCLNTFNQKEGWNKARSGP